MENLDFYEELNDCGIASLIDYYDPDDFGEDEELRMHFVGILDSYDKFLDLLDRRLNEAAEQEEMAEPESATIIIAGEVAVEAMGGLMDGATVVGEVAVEAIGGLLDGATVVGGAVVEIGGAVGEVVGDVVGGIFEALDL